MPDRKIAEQLKLLLIKYGFGTTQNARSLVTTCPACDRPKHLYIFLESGFSKCMRCGEMYSPQSLVVAITGCTMKEAMRVLGMAGKVTGKDRLAPIVIGPVLVRKSEPEELIECALPYNFFKLDDLNRFSEAWQYLQKRGIDQNIIQKYDLRYSIEMNRVVIPIYINKKCVGWQARDISGKSDIPYRSSTGLKRASVLMGYGQLDAKISHVILSEGPFDFLKLAFLNNVVCSMGKQVTLQQIQLLQHTKIPKIYLALDPDAWDLFDTIAYLLEPTQEVWLMIPPNNKKDFGDCTAEEMQKAFKEAKRYGRGCFISEKILLK